MKKMSRICCTLALLMSLGTVQTASALKLQAVSPNLNPATGGGGHPTWYQDINSIAAQPTGIPAAGFPVGFPAEFFYFMATSDAVPIDNSEVFVLFALEASWIMADGNLIPAPGTPASLTPAQQAGLKATTFQRMRMRVRPLGPIAPGDPTNLFINGIYKVDHPWGTTSFNCAGPSGNNASCQETTDVPVAAVIDPATGLLIGGFAPALGVATPNAGTFTGFDKFAQSNASVGTAFLGDGVTSGPIVSAGTLPLLRNELVITSPTGVIVHIPGFVVIGKTIGIEVQPGTTLDLGKVIMPATSAPTTVTVTNTTANPITFPGLATLAGTDALDFTVVAPAAAGATSCLSATPVAATSGTCSFDITFTPRNAVATAARIASITLTPTTTVVGASPAPPVTVKLSGTAQVKITTAVTTPHGTITPDATVDPVTGGAPAGSPVIFTVTPSSNKFKVKSVDDVAGAAASVPVPAPFTLNSGVANHTVTATFMQSGDLNIDGKVDVADALVALKIVAGIPQVADPLDPSNSAVKVAPLDAAGQPVALDAKLTPPDIGDVLVILRRALNLDAW